MIWYCALFFNLQIFVESATFSCPLSIPTISYVPSCPKNKEEWENAAKRKQCEAIKQNCTESQSDFQYHCLLNQRRDRTLEICAPIYYLQGFCGSYNFESKQIVGIYDEGRYKCLEYNGSEKCPSRYPSNEAYKYQRCYPYDDKNETRTTLQSPSATTAAYVYNECRSDDNTGVVAVIVILLVVTTIIIHILIWRHRERIWEKICNGGVHEEDNGNTETQPRMQEDIREEEDRNPEAQSLINQGVINSESLAKLNLENEELKRKIKENQGKAVSEDEIEKLQKEIKSLKDSLMQEKKAGEEKLQELQQLKDVHTKTKEKLQRKAVSEDEIEKLQNEIKSVKDSLMQEKKAGEEKFKELQQLKDVHTKTEENLQKSLIKAYDENEKLKREIDEHSVRLTEVNKENDDLKRKIEERDEKQVVKRKPAPQPPTDYYKRK